MKRATTVAFLSACLLLMGLSSHRAPVARAAPPNPVLAFLGQEFYQLGGKSFTRYQYQIANADAYPADLFAPAPALPPCGINTNASRTWVDVFDSRGVRLNGFCAISSGKDHIWFNLETGVLPPSWIYIELLDRQTGTKYKSNLAETTQ